MRKAWAMLGAINCLVGMKVGFPSLLRSGNSGVVPTCVLLEIRAGLRDRLRRVLLL